MLPRSCFITLINASLDCCTFCGYIFSSTFTEIGQSAILHYVNHGKNTISHFAQLLKLK